MKKRFQVHMKSLMFKINFLFKFVNLENKFGISFKYQCKRRNNVKKYKLSYKNINLLLLLNKNMMQRYNKQFKKLKNKINLNQILLRNQQFFQKMPFFLMLIKLNLKNNQKLFLKLKNLLNILKKLMMKKCITSLFWAILVLVKLQL